MCIIWVGKIVLIVLFLIIGCVSFFGTFANWRDVHNRLPDTDGNNEDIYLRFAPIGWTMFVEDNKIADVYEPLWKKCIEDFEDDKANHFPKDSGFYGDMAIEILIGTAFIVCIFNIIWTIISFFACCCDTCFLNLLPGTTFFVTVLLIISTIICAVDVDKYYGRYPVAFSTDLLSPANQDVGSAANIVVREAFDLPLKLKYGVKTDGDCHYVELDGEFPRHISYGAGFYLTILSIILNVGAFVLSLFVSFLRKIFCA